MKKNKISKNWLAKQRNDPYFRESKIQGYRSRAVYKLIEMNKKFKFIQKNSLLIDLGSSPGSWAQFASKEITKGKILAVDILPMKEIDKVDFINGDFLDKNIFEKIKIYFTSKADVILSDMASNTSGNKELDAYRTGELCLNAMNLSKEILRDNGVFLSKLFMGSVFKDINETAKKSFKKVVIYKPLSSKKESKEIYIYCKGVLKNDK